MIVGLAALVTCLPWRALGPRRLGALVGWLAGCVLRYRRRIVEAAMVGAGVPEPGRAARAMYARLGAGLLELLWLGGASPERRAQSLAAHVELEPEAVRALDEALALGPVVLLASHTGNWELAAAAAARALAARGRALAVVAKVQRVGAADRFIRGLRAALGIRVIDPRGAMFAGAAFLRAGGVVAMPIDQVPDRRQHAERVSFLGSLAYVDRAPATLALRCRATVLVVATRREGHAQRVRVLASLGPERGTREDVRKITCSATAALEAFVREGPGDWLWLHRRWRAPVTRTRRETLREMPRETHVSAFGASVGGSAAAAPAGGDSARSLVATRQTG